MNIKRWQIAPVDKALAFELAEECGIDALVALILVSRGFCDPFEVEEFLSDDFDLCDPYDLADMDKAVARIRFALEKGEKICVYGDYDADGVTSTAMLYTYLLDKGADVTYTVPERDEGYGLNNAAIDRMAADNVKLMITVDNGITAADEVAYAAKRGIDTVVTDHHLPQNVLPEAVAVVDPHRCDCPSYFKDYAGAGVCFKLICALEGDADAVCERYSDLAAVGTVACGGGNVDGGFFDDNSVKIMSIHKSKGLEFPYVIIADTSKGFNKTDAYKQMVLSRETGVGMRIRNDDLFTRYHSLSSNATENAIMFSTISEELRVLYVAMTRAKEHLTFFINVNDTSLANRVKLNHLLKNGNFRYFTSLSSSACFSQSSFCFSEIA